MNFKLKTLAAVPFLLATMGVANASLMMSFDDGATSLTITEVV